MAVQVFINFFDSIESYGSGTEVQIVDGHLLVLDSNQSIVAAFSPENWHHADVHADVKN